MLAGFDSVDTGQWRVVSSTIKNFQPQPSIEALLSSRLSSSIIDFLYSCALYFSLSCTQLSFAPNPGKRNVIVEIKRNLENEE